MREETPEVMLRSLLKTRLREGATVEAIHSELSAYGLNAEQIRALASEVSGEGPGPAEKLVAMLPLIAGVLCVFGLFVLYLMVELRTLAMCLVGMGVVAAALATLGLTFSAMIGGHVRRQNVLRTHIPDSTEGALMTSNRYVYLFAFFIVGAILILIGQGIDPYAYENLQKKAGIHEEHETFE